MKIVIYGLTITSAWGNGHATTFRSLVKALAARGHRVRFVEYDAPWYRANRDMPRPKFCSVRLYQNWRREEKSLVREASDADVVVVGSYFPDAIAASDALLAGTRAPVMFYDIDTPITLAGLRAEGRCRYLEETLVPKYAAYLSFTAGPVLRELETVFGAQQAVAFHCSVDPSLYKPTTVRKEWRCDLSYLGTYAQDRQKKLEELLNVTAAHLPDQEFIVAGAQYPEKIAWARNVRRVTHVAPPEHSAFYSSSRFTLNLTRADMVEAGWSPSVRLFEASACGAAIVSDQWAGIGEFLTPGEEVMLVESREQMTQVLREMPEAQRARMGRRARERILAEHTAERRAQQFEAIVSGLSVAAKTPQKSEGTLLAVPA
jgi:spore maturation protein CgeB